MSTTLWQRWKRRTYAFANDELAQPLFEPILHPSPWRVRALGLSCAFGNPLFYAIWTSWVPQPYERLWQRLGVSLLGILLLCMPGLQSQPPSRRVTLAVSTLFWLTLPVYFTWMYLCNERNPVWFATMASMFLIYYHLTDWRMATVGIASGIPAGWALFELAGPPLVSVPAEDLTAHTVVFAFTWYMGLMLGLSASNLRREQLKQALGTMGIMARELRTPLATMTLIGDAFRGEARHACLAAAWHFDQLADRLQSTVRHMNRHIDMQITNARLMQLPPATETVDAAQVVHEAVAGFPYRNACERECVQVHVVHGFRFRGSQALFTQVIDNLLKNAFRSLAGMPEPPRPGDLQVDIAVDKRRSGTGRVCISDRGQGMPAKLQTRLFQPFVSTNQHAGHGLGLAFCQRVVQACGGSIRVESAPGRGARFIIELPLV